MNPRTKHIAVKYHHFRSCVNKTLFIERVDTKEQLADIFTKPTPLSTFAYLREGIMGWLTMYKRKAHTRNCDEEFTKACNFAFHTTT